MNGTIPVFMGQREQQQVAHQVYLGMFLPLMPQLAVYRIAHGYEVEGGLSEAATPSRVAEEAHEYVDAAMKQLGFKKT